MFIKTGDYNLPYVDITDTPAYAGAGTVAVTFSQKFRTKLISMASKSRKLVANFRSGITSNWASTFDVYEIANGYLIASFVNSQSKLLVITFNFNIPSTLEIKVVDL